MQYDPIKDRFGRLMAGHTQRTRWFFAALQLLFLRAWYVRDRLRKEITKRKGPIRMLDAGTGFGQFSWWCVRKFTNVRVHAVDVKADYVEEAKRLFEDTGMDVRATFAVDDLVHLRATGPYDLILSVDVMEHIEEDEQVFANFFRVLRQGGALIVNTPSDQGGSDVYSGADSGEGFISEHVRDGYGQDELRAKLERAGFNVDSIDYTYGPMGSAAWRISIKWPMLLLGTSWAFVLFLPFYYAVVLPVALILNVLDVSSSNRTGTGLIAVAHRP